MRLHTACVAIQDLPAPDDEVMFRLMDAHYANVSRQAFSDDLAAKQWVLTLRTDLGELVGFSTQKVFHHRVAGAEGRVVFSGDTVISTPHRGTQALALAFGRFMLDLLQQEPSIPLYWLLTTKGLRTYRYLPLYFLEFFPRFDRETPPAMAQFMQELGSRLFPDRYDARLGLLTGGAGAQCLKPFEVSEARDSDPHAAFFMQRNPRFEQGDELLCIAPFFEHNIVPRTRRTLETQEPLRLNASAPGVTAVPRYAPLAS